MEFFDDTKSKNKYKINIDSQVDLVTNFFDRYADLEGEDNAYRSMLVDLYRAITCYRMYNNLEEFLAINPELTVCETDIRELWSEFDQLSSEELAQVALELLQDI